jgi:hypothetical protein
MVRPAILWVVAYGLLNLGLLLIFRPAPNADWAGTWWWVATDPWSHHYRYSPAFLPVVHLVVAIGPWGWAALHAAAIATLLRLGLPVLTLFALSAFVWHDVIAGNFFTFGLVAGAFAISGSRTGALAFLALTLVMPRPVQLPLALWLLCHRPDVRVPFAVMFTIHAVLVLLTGEGAVWAEVLIGSSSQVAAAYTIGPGAIIGSGWLLVGVPLGAALWLRNQPALAGLAVAPYLLPQYLGMALLAVVPRLAERPWVALLEGRGVDRLDLAAVRRRHGDAEVRPPIGVEQPAEEVHRRVVVRHGIGLARR